MSVNTTTTKVQFAGDGVSSSFPVTAFQIYLTSELAISIQNPTAAAIGTIGAGVTQNLTLGVDYSITLSATVPNTFTVVLINYSPLATGLILIVRSAYAQTQLAVLADNEKTPAATFQQVFDRAVVLIQQLQEQINRALVRDISQTTQLILPTLVAGGFLKTDGTGLSWAGQITSGTYIGKISSGLDAAKPATSAVGDIYIGYDTGIVYICGTPNSWTAIPATINGSALRMLSGIPAGSGIIPIANLATGTPTGSKFIRDDGTLQSFSTPLSSKKLLVNTNSGTPNTKVDISADAIIVTDGTFFQNLTTFSKTIDATTVGANGLDAGSLANSTNYYIWAIAKSDGTQAALLSTSATAPTMPSGYTYKALISGVLTDGSSHFIPFHQLQDQYWYDTWITIASGSTAITSVDMTKTCPAALSNIPFGAMSAGSVSGGVTNINVAIVVGNANAIWHGGNVTDIMMWWQLNILTANTLYYQGGNAAYRLFQAGFKINKI